MLALAGCDLEIPKDKELAYMQGGMEVSELPVTKPSIVKDDSLEPLYGVTKADGTEWTTADGLSISFYLEGYTNDWSMIFQTDAGSFALTCLQYCENGDWQANAWPVGYPSENSPAATYDVYLNADCFVTINITPSDITFYKNGDKMFHYADGDADEGGDTKKIGWAGDSPSSISGKYFPATMSKWCTGILDAIQDEGIYCIHPTDSWANGSAGDYSMTYFIVKEAIDADGAAALYENYKSYF